MFTEITAWLTTIVLYLGSFYKKERQAARPFIFPTEGLAITFYLSPLPQIDYTRARRREGMMITERGRKSFHQFSSTWPVRYWMLRRTVWNFIEQSCSSKWKTSNPFNFSKTIEEFKILLRLKISMRVWFPIIDLENPHHFEQRVSFNEHEFFPIFTRAFTCLVPNSRFSFSTKTISCKNSEKNSIYPSLLNHFSLSTR